VWGRGKSYRSRKDEEDQEYKLHKYKEGRGRVEEAEGIRTEVKRRRVWGEVKKEEEEEMSSISIREEEEE
jgi:hypothetical protein